MVIVGVHELWPLLAAWLGGHVIHLIKVSVNQTMVVIGAAACMDVLEGREEKRQQHPKACLYGRDTTHSALIVHLRLKQCARCSRVFNEGKLERR